MEIEPDHPVELDELLHNVDLTDYKTPLVALLQILFPLDQQAILGSDSVYNSVMDAWIAREAHIKAAQQASTSQWEAQVSHLENQINLLREEHQQAKALVAQTTKAEIDDLKRQLKTMVAKNSKLESQKDDYDALHVLAEKQAERDHEISRLRSELDRVMKGDIIASDKVDYLKSVIIKWASFVKTNDPKQASLVPVIGRILDFTDEELKRFSFCMFCFWPNASSS